MSQKPYYYKIILKDGAWATVEHSCQIDQYIRDCFDLVDRIEVVTR